MPDGLKSDKPPRHDPVRRQDPALAFRSFKM
jgi:hypothetical protein